MARRDGKHDNPQKRLQNSSLNLQQGNKFMKYREGELP